MSKQETILRNEVLVDCPQEYSFWINNGTIVRNIYELASAIEGMNDFTFRYHVNKDKNKNDFALWIKAVLKDEELASKLSNNIDKQNYLFIIKKRINDLEDSHQKAQLSSFQE